MLDPFANSGDPDQMPHSAASDLGLDCLPITWVSRLQWAKLLLMSNHNMFSWRNKKKKKQCFLVSKKQTNYQNYLEL